MLGRENTGAALGSGAVDDDFWALVCEDEEWLQAEFDAIVSEPCESPVRPSGRPTTIAAARPTGRCGSAEHPEPPGRGEPGTDPAGGGGGNDHLRMRPEYQSGLP